MKTNILKSRSLALSAAMVAAGMISLVLSSAASTITLTFTGTGSGSVGSTSFTDASFTITGIGDTTNRGSFSSGYWIDHTSTSIDITGVGVLSVLTGTRTFFNDGNDTPGFSRGGASGTDLFNGSNLGSLSGWDMTTSIGPVAGTFDLIQWSSPSVNTDQGVLVFSGGETAGTFKAEVGNSVPDGGTTLLLLGLGLSGMMGVRGFKKK